MSKEDMHSRVSRWRTGFEVCSTVLMLVLACVLVWQGRGGFVESRAAKPPLADAPVPTEAIQIDESTTQGAAAAQVAVIEFADFECSSCGEFASQLKPALAREYIDTGRVRFMFKNFPLRMHARGRAAAVAAWCASRQRRFWQMHDWLFSSLTHLDEDRLQQPGSEVGLDLTAYDSCRSGIEARQKIQEATSEAEALGIPATPTFYFGRISPEGRVQVSETMVGVRSMDAVRDILNRLLR